MPEAIPSNHPAEASFSPLARGSGNGGDTPQPPAVTISPGAAEAAHLLRDGQQLLLESRVDEAEVLLRRALELYEQNDPRADHVQADLAAALGSLARLYMHNGDYARAEPLLQRLLHIKRARGDDHPEVATVLASLARAHSAIGAHESAERILRRVLSIRERTLAPNHFATMTTLEHLAETCAARGNFGEALALLHNARTMRERTLGSAHPSIAAARTRIEDLELLASNEDVDARPMWALTTVPRTSPVLAIDAWPKDTVDACASTTAEAVVRPIEATPSIILPGQLDDDWEDDVDSATGGRLLMDRLTATVAAAAQFAQTPRGRVAVLAIGVASLLGALVLALVMRAPADAMTHAPAAVASSRAATSSGAPARVPDRDVSAQSAGALDDRGPMAGGSATRSQAASTSLRRSSESRIRETAPTPDRESAPLPTAPRIRALDAPIGDAVVAPLAAPLITSAEFTSPSASRDNAATRTSSNLTHAMLPEGNPAPEYPRDLMKRRIEGRVVAEFLVDANGRIDPRTARIVSSTDEAFSESVLQLLPKLRFLPAARDGAKVEEWVQMPFRFAPKPD